MEDSPERLKVMWPIRRSWFFFALFSASLVVWITMLAGMVVVIFRERFGFLLTTMLVIWLVVWFYLGRILWRRWQYFTATRELLFIDADRLILRRPVSILGPTDAYDMKHVTPFYVSEKHHCPAFDYGYQRVYFGQSLPPAVSDKLVKALNDRFFPFADDD